VIQVAHTVTAPRRTTVPVDDDGVIVPFESIAGEADAYRAVLAARLEHLRRLDADPHRDPLGARGLDPITGARADQLARASDRLAARTAATTAAGLTTPLARLIEAFELGPVEAELVMAAAAAERDREVGAAFAAAWPEANLQPEVGFYVRLFADPRVRELFRPWAPLVRHRVVELASPGHWLPEAPLLYRRVRLAERIGWFLEDVALAADAVDGLRWIPIPRAAGELGLDPELLARAIRTLEEPGQLAVVRAPAGAGKTTLIEAAAAALDRPVIVADLAAVPLDPARAEIRVVELVREARLRGAVLILDHAEVADEARREGLGGELARRLADHPLPVAALSSRDLAWVVGRTAAELRLALPTAAAQHELWQRELGGLQLAAGLELEGVVRRYALEPGAIVEACGELARLDRVEARGGVVDEAALSRAIRGRLAHRLGALASPVVTRLGWDDLIVPDEVRDSLGDIVRFSRHRDTVLGAWGLGAQIDYGRGLSALFSGPPGTGKTMAATIVARELGLELYRIDLSQVVNKFIGETEKNLGRVFDEAAAGQVVLLFDEADALFAKRTEVRSSHDRYGNLEINYLLQRMETFDGVVLLTTNAETAIDPAFRRRLRFRIRFPAPTDDDRELLWRRMFADPARLALDVDFAALAAAYPLVGGSIKNAALRAAIVAADRGARVSQPMLVAAARVEHEEMGFLARTTP